VLGILALAGALLQGPAAAVARELPLGSRSLDERRASVRVASGVTWTRIVREGGPWRVHVLTVDRRALGGRLTGVLSNRRIEGRERASVMARRARAVGGVNGGYFAEDGDPVGVLAIGGRLLSEPVDGRSGLVVPLDPALPARVASLSFTGAVASGGRERLVDGVERLRGSIPACGGRGGDAPTELPNSALTCTDPSELVVLSPRYGPSTRTSGGVEAVVHSGTVGGLESGDAAIPSDGLVLSGSGDAARFLTEAAPPGSRPEVRLGLFTRGAELPLAEQQLVVGGGPRLLSRGRIVVPSRAEGFAPLEAPGFYGSFVASRNPRTLAGVRRDGRILLVTIDGRRPGWSAGVTLTEAARVMQALGARDALNLDGGGSTTMTVRGAVVNFPSDPTGERPVSDGVFVVP
jgi:Phosphodiester glycosidase